MYRRQIECLIGIVILTAWVSAALAGTVSEEAQRYMARGIAAVEMAKSPGDYALAVKEFEQAARLAPDWPVIYYNLGSVQSKIGDYASAMKSYQRYLELAPRSPDAAKVQEEIFKLEYRRDREKLAAALAGTWTASNGHRFKLVQDGSNLKIARAENQSDDFVTVKTLGSTSTSVMNDSLVFSGTLVGDKISGQYLQEAGKSYCDVPERKGNFDGTVDTAAGQIRIVYNRVAFGFFMELKSFFSSEVVCSQTDRKETPGYVLELKRDPASPAQTGK